MKDLSIIVPIYNVEKYVFQCLDSLYNQELVEDCFEVIIVNDGTKDRSMDIVSEFAKCHSNIIIINQENRGLSVARNNGLARATGRYIMFVDSDDFIVKGCLPILLSKAIEHSVDMLIADFVKMTDEEIERSIPNCKNKRYAENVMTGREAFVNFLNPVQCYIWRIIYSRDFLYKNRLTFIPGIYFEDIPFTIECFLKVNKSVVYLSPFYIYRQHYNSIVSTINKKKLLDFNRILLHLWTLLKTEMLSKDDYYKLMDTIFVTFSIEMWYLSHDKSVFPYRREIVEDLKEKVPNLYFCGGVKQRFISLIFRWWPYACLWIRSLQFFK